MASEHAYRGGLETLIRELAPQVDVFNEPSKIPDCGNPDDVIITQILPLLFTPVRSNHGIQ